MPIRRYQTCGDGFFISGWLTQYCWSETYLAWHWGYLQLSNLLMTASSAKCFSSSFLMMWSCMKLFPHQCTQSPKHFFKALSPLWKSYDNSWVISILPYQTVIKDLTLSKKSQTVADIRWSGRNVLLLVFFRHRCTLETFSKLLVCAGTGLMIKDYLK